MRMMLWRVVYVVIIALVLSLVLPPFLAFIGFVIPADAYHLLKICLALIALLYVVFGGEVPAPF